MRRRRRGVRGARLGGGWWWPDRSADDHEDWSSDCFANRCDDHGESGGLEIVDIEATVVVVDHGAGGDLHPQLRNAPIFGHTEVARLGVRLGLDLESFDGADDPV